MFRVCLCLCQHVNRFHLPRYDSKCETNIRNDGAYCHYKPLPVHHSIYLFAHEIISFSKQTHMELDIGCDKNTKFKTSMKLNVHTDRMKKTAFELKSEYKRFWESFSFQFFPIHVVRVNEIWYLMDATTFHNNILFDFHTQHIRLIAELSANNFSFQSLANKCQEEEEEEEKEKNWRRQVMRL